jgi:hypothetical protein
MDVEIETSIWYRYDRCGAPRAFLTAEQRNQPVQANVNTSKKACPAPKSLNNAYVVRKSVRYPRQAAGSRYHGHPTP